MLIEPLMQHSPSRRVYVTVSIIVGILLFLAIMYNETPITRGKTTFYIPSSSIEAVIKSLEENGYELNTVDHLLLRVIHLPKKGWYKIRGEELGRFFFLKNLYKKRVEVLSIRVFAGETKKEIFYRLSRDLMLDEKKLDGNYTKLARFQEGNILADRYLLPRSPGEENIIKYMLEKSNRQLDNFARQHFGSDFNTSQMRETLIIASIIQRESNDIDEMADISSVIHNRLNSGMRLQMDGTLNYGRYSRTVVTPQRIKSDRSRYNTYHHKGLVPAPLGSVSIDAIQAAAFPHKNKYLFFVLGENGKHIFASSYKKHLNNVKAFKKWLRMREAKKKREESRKRAQENQRQSKARVAIVTDHNQSHTTEKKKRTIPCKENNRTKCAVKKKQQQNKKSNGDKKEQKQDKKAVSKSKVPQEGSVWKRVTVEKEAKQEENNTSITRKHTKDTDSKYKKKPNDTKSRSASKRKSSVDSKQIQKLFSDINASKK